MSAFSGNFEGDKPCRAYVQAGGGGYGARVFIPYKDIYPATVTYLGHKCLWGGADKDTGKCYGWEIPNDTRVKEIISYLENHGYSVEKVGTGNINEVWK